ncbi:TPA: hypothetical protein ACPYU1_000841 [Raoultella planticola]
MLKSLLALAVIVLSGCTHAPNLPSTDTIIKVKPIESGIIANSDKYTYRFFRRGVTQEYQRYKTFYQQFHQIASGVRVNFEVKQHEVTAGYLVVLDKRKLSTQQQSILTRQYQATPLGNEQIGVLFKATGFWSTVTPTELDDAYRLSRPIVVSINDKTQTISDLGAIALIPLVPLFPLYMMYGCAVGPCV